VTPRRICAGLMALTRLAEILEKLRLFGFARLRKTSPFSA
jgi:hypothetical protein